MKAILFPFYTFIYKERQVKQGQRIEQKNQPIVPKIHPWTNEEYVNYAQELEEEYVTINMENYGEFFDTIDEYKHPEVTYAAQEMYEYIDNAIQNIFTNPDTANPKALLQTANANMQNYLDQHINK